MVGFGKDPWIEYPAGQLEYKKQLFADNNLRHPQCSNFYHNTHYYVMVWDRETEWGIVKHLMVSDRKGRKIPDHWKFLQNVKNEICGSDRLAIEVYPPVAELVDDVNAYHLWVLPEGFKLPFGLSEKGWM